jgi:hypothetical protein
MENIGLPTRLRHSAAFVEALALPSGCKRVLRSLIERTCGRQHACLVSVPSAVLVQLAGPQRQGRLSTADLVRRCLRELREIGLVRWTHLPGVRIVEVNVPALRGAAATWSPQHKPLDARA